MTIKTTFKIGVLFTALFFVSMTFIQVANGQVEVENDNGTAIEMSLIYTNTELENLYQKNNITENDLKFAKDQLPNYLKGSVLNGDLRVIATEDGKPPKGLEEGKDYDLIISHEKMLDIVDEARKKYIKKYGVDPANPKISIVNGYALPNEEVNKLVTSGKIVLQSDSPLEEEQNISILSVSSNPCAINKEIIVNVFVAKDSRHKPTESIATETIDGLSRFVREPGKFGITISANWYWNYWDASNIKTANNASQALSDLKNDTSKYRTKKNILAIGWAHKMNRNGIAYHNGAYALCADTTSAPRLDWSHASIVQHEISHNFGADDVDSSHPACIMRYSSAYLGNIIWCTSCKKTVNYGIYH